MAAAEEELLVVEREAEMAPSATASAGGGGAVAAASARGGGAVAEGGGAVADAGDEPIKRKGFFLAPRQNPNGNPLVTLHSPNRYKSVSFSTLESPKILFKGWSSSLKQWDQWVSKLKPSHGDSWKKVGIFDAIVASTCRIRRDPCSFLGVSSFWCDESNTFLLPWGEATITLEDVSVLVGFSVLGEPVRAPPLEGELKDLELRITEERLRFNRSSYKKPDHSAWLKHFIERDGDELEHVAFLSLWLSRFVFCSHPEKTIRQHVLPIAVRIARGERIALAPAILARIYQDLRELKDYLASNERSEEFPLIIWAPLHILQVWIWERFASLRPEANNSVDGGGPRMTRWHEMGKKTELSFVQSTLNSPTEFQWRPYGISLSDFSGDQANSEKSRSFAVCLRDCELVGVDCIEQYIPHRVARQFGLDQDVPVAVATPLSDLKWEVAWESYEIRAKKFSFKFPRQLVESGVTVQYAKWWEQYMMACSSNAVEYAKEGEEPVKNVKRSQKKITDKKKKKKKGMVLLTGKKRKLADVYDATLSDWLTNNHHNVRAKKNGLESQEPPVNAVEIRKKKNLVEKPKENKKRKRANGHYEKNCVKSQEPSLNAVEIKKKQQTHAVKPKENKKRKQANGVEEKIHVKSEEPSSNGLERKNMQTCVVKPKEKKKKKKANGSEGKTEHKSRAHCETKEGERISKGDNSSSNPLAKKEKVVKNHKKKNQVKSQEPSKSAVKVSKQKNRAIEHKIGKKKENKRGCEEKIEIKSKASGETKVEERVLSGETYLSDPMAKNVKEMAEHDAKIDDRECKENGEARSPDQAREGSENGTIMVDMEEKVLIEERAPSGVAPPSDHRERKKNEEDRSLEQATVAGENDKVLIENVKKTSNEEINEDVKMMDNGEYGCSPHVIQEPKEDIPLEQENKREENEGLIAVTSEEEKMIVEDNGDYLCNPAVLEEPERVIPLEKADQRGENMEIVEKGKEDEVVEEEVEKVDDRRTESEEALPTEETSQRGEEKEIVVEKDKEEEVIEEEEKRIDDGIMESEKALRTDETIQRGEEKEIANKDIEEREIAKKDIKKEEIINEDLEDKEIVEAVERINGGESSSYLIVTKAPETIAPAQANDGEEEKEISEKTEEEEIVVEAVKRINDGESPNDSTVIKEGEGEENSGVEEKANAEDIQRTNDAANPPDLAFIKETVEAEGMKDKEFGSDRINACNQLGQEGKEDTEEVTKPNIGESHDILKVIREKEGILTPTKEDRRRNGGDSSNMPVKNVRERETLKNVNEEFKAESTIEVIVVEENEGRASSNHGRRKVERIEKQHSPRSSKESKLEMEIRKLKEEIAAIEARVLNLESIAEVQSGS